jgi:hypothetical protein
LIFVAKDAMAKILPALILLFFSICANSQDDAQKRISFGLEQDLLPYATGGYFAGGWVGMDHVRVRALTAKVNKPDFIVKDGFANNKVTAYAVLADYFFKENWKGWWAGAGWVYWKSSIQTSRKINTAYYYNWMVNGSVGYNFSFGKRIYISPWCGMHVRIAGDKYVAVDDKIFKPALLNPEGSVKVGVKL